jgi:cytochrome c5
VTLAAAVLAVALAGRGALSPAAPAAEPASKGAAAAEDYGGLPEAPGRTAVYFNCTACHSIKQFSQQRLSREQWDAVLDQMVAKNGMHPLQPWARRLVLNYLATHFGAHMDTWQGLPVGKGREVVFGLCQACHSLAIVKQQGLSRASWDETLTWMVEEQGMPALDPATRNLVLDYLATHYGLGTEPARPVPGAVGAGGARGQASQ